MGEVRVTTASLKGIASIVALVVSALPSLAQCPDGLVTKKVDRFTGMTMTETNLKLSAAALEAQVFVPNLVAGLEEGGESFFMMLTLSGIFKQQSYKDCHYVFILADGERIQTGGDLSDTIYQSQALPGGATHELIKVALVGNSAYTTVAKLGRAKKIEFRVCYMEFEADPEFARAAHEFACKVSRGRIW
jgi:hypothetical protein